MKPTERFALVADDDVSLINARATRGAMRQAMPDDVWALQWWGADAGGEIEYRDGSVARIERLPGWAVGLYNATKTRQAAEDAAAAEAEQ